MIPILILTAILSAFGGGPIVTDVGGGVPTAAAAMVSVDDVGGGVPTR
jgi:hypothetical protein